MNKKKRNYNFDILRVIAMLMIIIHHVTVNDLGLQKYLITKEITLSDIQTFILIGINSLVVIGVNIFFLLSGYFGIKSSIKKIISLLLTIYLLYIPITLIGVKLGYVPWNKETIMNLINPLNVYWFLLVYVLIIIISPFLNKMIKTTTKKEAKIFFIITIIIFSLYSSFNDNNILLNKGYSFLWGMILYMLGGYIKKYKIENRKGLLFYFLFAIINSIIISIIFKLNNHTLAWQQYAYNNIFVLLESLSLFVYFNSLDTLKHKYKVISLLASSTLITYLLHSSCWLTKYRNIPVKKLIETNNFKLALILLPFYALFIYLLCTMVSIVYNNTIQKGINKFFSKRNIEKYWF